MASVELHCQPFVQNGFSGIGESCMPDYSQSEHLMLDGYNLIHAIPKFQHLLRRQGMDAARARFEDYSRCLHEPGKVRLTIVYDGQGAKDEILQLIPGDPGLAIVFTQKGASADEFIERIIAGAPRPHKIYVATNDLAIVQTFATMGAFTLRADDLVGRADRLQKIQRRALDRIRVKNRNQWDGRELREKLKGL
jgi:predicted RNA-binding protein with PIN domain